MGKIFTNDGVLIAKVMRDHLNSWSKKPAEIKLEDLGKKAPSMMLQQLSSAEKVKSYVNGSYIGVWRFAVWIRVEAEDTASRLDAIAVLTELAEWLGETDESGDFKNLPVIDERRIATGFSMPATPSIAARYDDGTEEYQAIMSLEYKSRRI